MSGHVRKRSRLHRAAPALLAAAAGCTLVGRPPEPRPTPIGEVPAVVPETPVEPEPSRIEPPLELAGNEPPPPVDEEGLTWPERTLARMTLREKVGQMMMPWVLGDFSPEGSTDHERLRVLVEDQGVGGIIVSVGSPTEVAVKLNDLQDHARVPLLVGSDLESGAGFRLRGAIHVPTGFALGGATEFPFQMALGATGDTDLAYEMGRITALEGRTVGIHVPFVPILDVNNNPDNPIINVRSFGEDPELVARMGTAFVQGIQEHGGIAVGKHFPGHGDTGVDTHQQLALITAARPRLDTVELAPFRAAIEAGMRGVMTAHVSVPALAGGSTDPATLSHDVMTRLLREEMGFQGLLFTDAMDMGAIDRGFGRSEAAVRAVEAGADVILMPPSVPEAIDAIVRSVLNGRLSEQRIDESVLRILEVKESLGLHVDPMVTPARVPRVVGVSEHVALARTIAERSLVLLRNERGLLPLAGTRSARVLSVTFRRAADLLAGRYFNGTLRATYPRLVDEATDRDTPVAVWDGLRRQARESQLVVVSVYVTAWDAGAIPDELVEFLDELGRHRVPHVVVSFGNPYLFRRFPDVQAYLLAWSGAEVSQRAAAGALLGQIPVTGRLPTRIPPWFEIGEGIQLLGRALPAPPRSRERLPVTAHPVESDPASVGMNARALERVDSLVLAALADSTAPGAALAIGRHGRLVRLRGYGTLDYASDRPVTASTLFDLASLTKVVATTTVAMLLEADGRLDLDEPVVRYLSWWAGPDRRKQQVTVRQLLVHRAGLAPFPDWFRERRGREDYRDALAAARLEYDPGTRTLYSDIGFITLGFIIEDVAGVPLDQFLETRVWELMGMVDTGFTPDPALLPRIAPTEVDTLWRGVHVHGTVHDENAYAMGGVAGHAGLFSSAWDLAIFADLMLAGGVLPVCAPSDATGVACTRARPAPLRILPEQTVRRWTRRADPSASFALGWDTPEGSTSSAGIFMSAQAFGHTGFTGTSMWIDPELDLFVVLLTNRVNPTRDNPRHIPLRRAVHDAVARAVSDRTVSAREL